MPLVGKLKSGKLYIGGGYHTVFNIYPRGEVTLTATEDHPLWGRRYQVQGQKPDIWFEANCFEYVKEVN